MHSPRFREVLPRVQELYPNRRGVALNAALIEGLSSLARIAITARIARRTLRLVTFHIESARTTIENAVSAAEKISGGFAISPDEDRAGKDRSILDAVDLEKRQGNAAAAEAASVARYAARCVYGPELAYGENALLAEVHLQGSIQFGCRKSGLGKEETERAVMVELEGFEADVVNLILHADSAGDQWHDPELDEPLARSKRGWELLLESAGVRPGSWRSEGEKWQIIHAEIRRTGGLFYPSRIFESLKATTDQSDGSD